MNAFLGARIAIASILLVIGMAIGVLVEALLPGGNGAGTGVSLQLKMKNVRKNGSETN